MLVRVRGGGGVRLGFALGFGLGLGFGFTKHWGIGPECCEQSEHVRRQHSTKDVTKKTTDDN